MPSFWFTKMIAWGTFTFKVAEEVVENVTNNSISYEKSDTFSLFIIIIKNQYKCDGRRRYDITFIHNLLNKTIPYLYQQNQHILSTLHYLNVIRLSQ